MAALHALAWVGGKSAHANQGTGPWVASLLPDDTRVTYIEPFAGMLGVLLQRPKANTELVNDTNDRLVNWWRCLRDRPDELLRLVRHTPHARDEFEHAVDHLDDPALSPVVRAAHFTTVIRQSIRSSDRVERSSWRRHLRVGACGTPVRNAATLSDQLAAVAERICDVQVENIDAVALLERVADLERVVVYCDPPYPTANQTLYEKSVDFAALADVLKAQTGRVAVSGYGKEWDHLGWRRHTHETVRHTPGVAEMSPRTEVLWTNYDPARQGQRLF